MNRRECLKSIGASLAAFILPAARPRIDLMEFCRRDECGKYDLRLPFEVDDWTYATDARVCVRVRPIVADKVQTTGPIPPFHHLSWNHDCLRGWQPMKCLRPIMAADSDCPTCDGTGYLPGVIAQECEPCGGTGHEWVGSAYDISHPITCRHCKGRGHYAPCEECATCHGNAIGTFPALVKIGDAHFDANLYAKAQRLGGEMFRDNWNGIPRYPLLKFRFDGGDGLLVGIRQEDAARRIREAAK